jgi:hypothetical protein
MARRDLSYWDYVKAAFHRHVNVPLLGGMPANKMALGVFAVLGIANPGFWFLGAAAEVAYLGILSSSARFQKLVQGERLLERAQSHDAQVERAFKRLGHSSQMRYRTLVDECRQILGLAEPRGRSEVLQGVRTGNLNELLWLFMRLLTSRELIESTRTRVNRDQLQDDIVSLRARAEAAEAGSPLARSLQATLAIQGKRLENLDNAEHNLAVVDAELERIEQQVRLIREESAVSGGPEMLSARLDAVSSTLTETSRWMDRNADLFSSLGTEEGLSSSLPTLPQAPAAEGPPPIPPPKRKRQRER